MEVFPFNLVIFISEKLYRRVFQLSIKKFIKLFHTHSVLSHDKYTVFYCICTKIMQDFTEFA